MPDIKLGYAEPMLTKKKLGDGSVVFGVLIVGDHLIHIRCIDENSAENLMDVWNFSVVGVDIDEKKEILHSTKTKKMEILKARARRHGDAHKTA